MLKELQPRKKNLPGSSRKIFLHIEKLCAQLSNKATMGMVQMESTVESATPILATLL